MKSNFTQLSIFIAFLFLMLSCQENVDLEKKEEKGNFALSFSKTTIPNLRIAENDSLKPSFIVISVKNSEGDLVLNAEKLALTKIGNAYFTPNVQLEEGAYTIEDFLVTDSENETIYLTPKEGSDYAQYVQTPLPFSFNVEAENTSEVVLDVLPVSLGLASDFGYATFSFNVVKVLEIRPDSTSSKDALFISRLPERTDHDRPDIHLYVNTHNGVLNINRVSIDFGIEKLPRNIVIDSAKVSFYFNSTSIYLSSNNTQGHLGNNSFSIQKITQAWEEKTITWNNQPNVSDLNKVIVPDTDIIDYDFENIDVTGLVKDMYENPSEGFGFMLKHIDETPKNVTF